MHFGFLCYFHKSIWLNFQVGKHYSYGQLHVRHVIQVHFLGHISISIFHKEYERLQDKQNTPILYLTCSKGLVVIAMVNSREKTK